MCSPRLLADVADLSHCLLRRHVPPGRLVIPLARLTSDTRALAAEAWPTDPQGRRTACPQPTRKDDMAVSLNDVAKQLGVSRTFLRAITGAHGPTSNPHFPEQTIRQIAEEIQRDTEEFLEERSSSSPCARERLLEEMMRIV